MIVDNKYQYTTMDFISKEVLPYRLAGDLTLEDPSTFLDSPRLSRLAELEPHFNLENDYGQVSLLGYTCRIFQELISRRPDTTNHIAFAVLNLVPLSMRNPPRSASELVRPSGELDSSPLLRTISTTHLSTQII